MIISVQTFEAACTFCNQPFEYKGQRVFKQELELREKILKTDWEARLNESWDEEVICPTCKQAEQEEKDGKKSIPRAELRRLRTILTK